MPATGFAPELAAAVPQGPGFQADIRFVNNAPWERREWGLATVPFPQGVWTPGRTFEVAGVPSHLLPFGQRWPDGSVRFAQLAAQIHLQPGEERLIRVRPGTPGHQAFQYSPWVQGGLVATTTPFDLEFVVGLAGGVQHRVPLPAQSTLVDDTPAYVTRHYRDRLPATNLVFDFWVTFFHDQDNARFELRLTSASTASPLWEESIDYFGIATHGCLPLVRGAIREGHCGSITGPLHTNAVILLGAESFFTGQAREWFGELLFVDSGHAMPDGELRVRSLFSAAMEPFYGMATNWSSSGAYGPFGYLPTPPAWIRDGGRQAAILDRTGFLDQYYWQLGSSWEDRPKAMFPYPGTTGTQHDFGVGKYVDVFVSGMPQLIEEARYTAGEEAQRPVHHREADGSPVRSANHPNWVVLGGRTHWSDTISPDRLGKPYPLLSTSGRSNGWSGKDHEHWSSLVLAAAYMMTRSHSLAMELDNEAELYLASHTLPSLTPGLTTNNVGRPRATGRSMLTMSWTAMLIDRADLMMRLAKRAEECVLPRHFGMSATGPVRPMELRAPDPRSITSGQYWTPWEEAQAVLGLEANHRVTGSPHARAVAEFTAKNLIEHGWRVDFDNTAVGFGLRYLPGGAPIPLHLLNSGEYAAWASDEFKSWCLPATRLAMQYATTAGDSELLERARVIHEFTMSSRFEPRSGNGWDLFSGWDGVAR